MESTGERIRSLRLEKQYSLKQVSDSLGIDQGLLSKIERGQRKATREQVEKLAGYFGADKNELLVAWMSDRIAYELGDESFAEEVLKVAEEKVAYQKFIRTDRGRIIQKIRAFLEKDGRVMRAWVFGSFSRGDDHPGSDIDIMVEEKPSGKFNYFDLADIQHRLQQLLGRKIDIGFASSLRENTAENIRKEAKLIYESR